MPGAAGFRRAGATAAALVATSLAAGCGGDERQGGQTTTTPPSPETTAGRESERCTNDQGGYSVRYPADWHVNSGEVTAACSLFDPEPFDVPEAQDVTGIAIQISREPVAFDRAAGKDLGMRSVETEEVRVDGRKAIRRTYESTGQALLPEGVRGYQYVVDLEGEALIAGTLDVGDLDFERNRRVLDRMMESLRLEK